MRQEANAADGAVGEIMAKFALHNDKSAGGCVLNSLQLVNMSLRHTILQTITVVYSATNKRVDKNRSCIH